MNNILRLCSLVLCCRFEEEVDVPGAAPTHTLAGRPILNNNGETIGSILLGNKVNGPEGEMFNSSDMGLLEYVTPALSHVITTTVLYANTSGLI